MRKVVRIFCIIICLTFMSGIGYAYTAKSPFIETINTKIEGSAIKGIKIKEGSFRTDVVLANNRLGNVKELAKIAKDNKAWVAVNGTFFNAYTKENFKEPYHNIISKGQIIHIGNTGSTFGFTADGKVKMGAIKLSGKLVAADGYEYLAWAINRKFNKRPTDPLIVTPHWGATTGYKNGKNIIVSKQKIIDINTKDNAKIPQDGFILFIPTPQPYLETHFKVGDEVKFKIVVQDKKTGKERDWSDIVTAIGSGPTLVTGGKIALDAKGEGFTESKIINQASYRCAIGVNKKGEIFIINTTATCAKLANIMKQLGCIEAMNLDGGASAGIYYNEKYLSKPGRNISNALLFYKK